MSIKCWTRRHYLKRKSGSKSWSFYSKPLDGHFNIEWYRSTDDWFVTFHPLDLCTEEFYPAKGFGDTLKEAIQEFRKDLKSERKRFYHEETN